MSRSVRWSLGLVGLMALAADNLTGPVQLSDEEFSTLADRAVLIVTAMFAAILVMLWFAVESSRMIVCILVTLFAGLAVTAAIGLAIAGAFNIISVAFIVLFVGIGVDFGIQFCVRYRGERHAYGELGTAIVNAGRGIGAPLALAAAATAAGFFSFLPTEYLGVAELGLVAGIGGNAEVTSPTFTLIHEYTGGRLPVYHFDFFRIEDREAAERLGLDEYFFGDGVSVVEWADKFREIIPADALWISFETKSEDERLLILP